MRSPLLTALVLAVAAGVGAAQVAYVLDAGLPGIASDVYLPSAAYPAGAPGPIGPAPIPAAGLLAFATGFGGMAIDQTTSLVYSTDGFVVTLDVLPAYLPFPPVPPPPPPGPYPIATPPGFGPITGLAVDTAAGILWMCDAGAVAPYPLAPPFAPLAAPAAIPVPVGPLTGLGFDPATGGLWATSVAGVTFSFTPPPGPVVLVPPTPPGLPPVGPVGGLTVNTTNGPGAFPPPLCSAELPAPVAHVLITDGFMVYDNTGLLPPAPLNAGPTGLGAYGLSYSSDYQVLPGATGCLTTGTFPFAGTASPNISGGPNALMLAGAPPASPVTFMADLCPLPGGAILATGEILHINPFTAILAGAFTNAVGLAAIPVGFGAAPPGLEFVFQWAIPDALHPLGFCLSDAVMVTTGLP